MVLCRAEDEDVVLRVPPSEKETEIVVTVVEFRTRAYIPKVKLGFHAEREVTINRGEVQKAIDAGVRK